MALRQLLKFGLFIPTLLLGVACSSGQASDQLSTQSKEEIGEIVREYILENPEIILEAIEILQAREEQQQASNDQSKLADLQPMLLNNSTDPVGGNPEGTITIVEFFDYNCGYCKRSSSVLQQLVANNDNLRVVFKEWPILSESSAVAARIALATNIAYPDRYEELHHALLSASSIRSANDVWFIVGKLGLDKSKIEPLLNSPEVNSHIQQTGSLAQALGITGTPAFIVGDHVLKGAYPLEDIQRAIDSQS